jgi:chromosome segregation protein
LFLTKLELHGFKSFVDATDVSFGNGITAVVGPNGCGKTNISDAIRWVMGEQSAKQLRGDAMDDVIFNGSARRKPIGMAEVTLTMLNDKGILPTEYTSVEIGRRVYRSGVSEYVLNKQIVRLKDIKDLFFDTGMGSHAYSVIERSMVDNLLSDNTGHRRFLFEEASGITKYKQRKKEALNKLEATQTDLVRVTDLLVEIEKELGSLARQVAKARRYERLRGEIQDLDLRLSAQRHEGLIAREKELAEEHQAESVRREAAQTELDTRDAALQSLKIEQIEEERTLAAAQQALSEREAARASAQHEALVLTERGSGLSRRIEELDAELARATERLTELAAQESSLREQVASLESEEAQRRTSLAEREAALSEIEGTLKESRSEAASKQQLALDLFQAESKERAEVERARERLSNLAERREAVEGALKLLATRLEQITTDHAQAEVDSAAHAAAYTEAQARAEALEAQGRELEADGARRAEAESTLRAEVAATSSRLATLEELKRAYEGVDEAVKAALSERREKGALGLVADLLDVPAEWVDAASAALGSSLQAVVFADGNALDEASQAQDKGRVAFVALDRARGVGAALAEAQASRLPAAGAWPGAVALAREVKARDGADALVAALLTGTFALEDEAEARRASGEVPRVHVGVAPRHRSCARIGHCRSRAGCRSWPAAPRARDPGAGHGEGRARGAARRGRGGPRRLAVGARSLAGRVARSTARSSRGLREAAVREQVAHRDADARTRPRPSPSRRRAWPRRWPSRTTRRRSPSRCRRSRPRSPRSPAARPRRAARRSRSSRRSPSSSGSARSTRPRRSPRASAGTRRLRACRP